MPIPRSVSAAVSEAPLLALQDVRIDYPQRHGKTTLRAVDGVSLQIARGETVGLVGESGCGKSTLSKAILRLVPTAGGEIRLRGTDLVPLGERELRPLRRHVQMVFQDPYASLNPRRTVAEILDTVLVVNGDWQRAAAPLTYRQPCSIGSVCRARRSAAFRTSSQAANGNALALRGRWCSNPIC